MIMIRLCLLLILSIGYSYQLMSQTSIGWQKTLGGSSVDEAIDIVSGETGTCLFVGLALINYLRCLLIKRGGSVVG